MANKLIRNIPDASMAVIKSKAAASGMETEAYLRDLIERDAQVAVTDDTYRSIRLEVGYIDDMLDSLKDQLKPWIEFSLERLKADVINPVGCLAALGYITSDLLHATQMMNKAVDTVRGEFEA